jgi:hypothetical protein
MERCLIYSPIARTADKRHLVSGLALRKNKIKFFFAHMAHDTGNIVRRMLAVRIHHYDYFGAQARRGGAPSFQSRPLAHVNAVPKGI